MAPWTPRHTYRNYGYVYYDGKVGNFLIDCLSESDGQRGTYHAVISDYGGCGPEAKPKVEESLSFPTFPPAWLVPLSNGKAPYNTVANALCWMAPLLLDIAGVKIRTEWSYYDSATIPMVSTSTEEKAAEAFRKVFNDECKPPVSPACKAILQYCSRYNPLTNQFSETMRFRRKRPVSIDELLETESPGGLPIIFGNF